MKNVSITLVAAALAFLCGLRVGEALPPQAPAPEIIILAVDTPRAPLWPAYDVPLCENLQWWAYETSKASNVPYTLTLAVMWRESNFNSKLISSTRDYGLMQINVCNHARLADEYNLVDMLDPFQNITAGVYMLAEKLDFSEGDIEYALLAYNLGNTGAKRARANGVYSTKYTRAILAKMAEYEG